MQAIIILILCVVNKSSKAVYLHNTNCYIIFASKFNGSLCAYFKIGCTRMKFSKKYLNTFDVAMVLTIVSIVRIQNLG